MLINDLIDIKAKNAKCILNAVRFREMMTKKDVAGITSLSFATVSNLSNELKGLGILVDTKVDEKRVGRSPNALNLNDTQYLMAALDLQLENTLGFAVVNLKNELIDRRILDISHLRSDREIVAFARELYDRFLAAYPVKDVHFIGVGAAVPAVFDSQDGRLVLSSVPVYENSPLKELLKQAFGMPAYVDNIANISALSAYTRCQAQQDIVCLDVSQGVGVGVITSGNLLRGKNGYATEVAHVPIGNPALACPYCGGYGCVETELSISGMTRYYPEIGEGLPLLQRWAQFVAKMREGGERSETVARRVGGLAGQLATILINLFDPEVFFVTGYFTQVFDRFRPYFDREIELRCRMSLNRGLQIVVDQETPQTEQVYLGLCDALYNIWNPLS